jgi:hypothetical protein
LVTRSFFLSFFIPNFLSFNFLFGIFNNAYIKNLDVVKLIFTFRPCLLAWCINQSIYLLNLKIKKKITVMGYENFLIQIQSKYKWRWDGIYSIGHIYVFFSCYMKEIWIRNFLKVERTLMLIDLQFIRVKCILWK